jgi:hypothetical protein
VEPLPEKELAVRRLNYGLSGAPLQPESHWEKSSTASVNSYLKETERRWMLAPHPPLTTATLYRDHWVA